MCAIFGMSEQPKPKGAKATKKQIRERYELLGYDVRISRENEVLIRRGDSEWRGGTWIGNYRVVEGLVVVQ